MATVTQKILYILSSHPYYLLSLKCGLLQNKLAGTITGMYIHHAYMYRMAQKSKFYILSLLHSTGNLQLKRYYRRHHT